MSVTDIRPRGIVEAVYEEAMTIRSVMSRHGDDEAYLRQVDGILATVTWALRRSLSAPVSECRSTDPDALAAEERLVTAELDRTAISDARRRSYLTAVRDTLRWLTGETETLPL